MRALLVAVPGVQQVEVNFDEAVATVQYDDRQASLSDMTSMLESGGYKSWSTETEIPKKKL